jgi:hypothetical protein
MFVFLIDVLQWQPKPSNQVARYLKQPTTHHLKPSTNFLRRLKKKPAATGI